MFFLVFGVVWLTGVSVVGVALFRAYGRGELVVTTGPNPSLSSNSQDDLAPPYHTGRGRYRSWDGL